MPRESLTVGEVLRRQARARGEHPLLVCDAERLSYAEADRRSAQLARGLIAFVYFLGRRGSMIKTRGANVAPAAVQRAIAKVTGGTVAYVLGLPDPERGQLVAAVVALEEGAEFDEAGLRERLKAKLSAYKIPKRFAAVPRSDIPVLSSGKVDLAALQKVFDA